MRRALLALTLLSVLAACQLALPGRDSAPATATGNPVTGDPITTTTLDAPTLAPATPEDAAAPAAASGQGPATPEQAAPAPSDAPSDARTEQPTEEPAADEAPPPVPEPVATPIPKSEAQIACEDDGGTWARTGDGPAMACVEPTRDGGKRCDSKNDCDGECLARSRTCSPIAPLFGCNAVLMDNGAEVTLCLN